MQNAGAYLKAVREEKGYTVQEVTKSTKISPAVVRALEEGRLDNIDPVYLKGFLKMYCRFLGINWEEFLAEHPISSLSAKHPQRQAFLAQQKQEKKARAQAAELPRVAFNTLILKHKKAVLIGLSVTAGVFFLILLLRGCTLALKAFKQPRPPSTKKIEKTAPVAVKKPAQTPSQAKDVPAVKVKSLPPENSPPRAATPAITLPKEVKAKEINLVISAQENSYLKIKVDAKTVYQGILRKGKAESWIAKDKIELSVGNAGGIVLELNGKTLSSLGRRGQAVKNILINSEGLKVL